MWRDCKERSSCICATDKPAFTGEPGDLHSADAAYTQGCTHLSLLYARRYACAQTQHRWHIPPHRTRKEKKKLGMPPSLSVKDIASAIHMVERLTLE